MYTLLNEPPCTNLNQNSDFTNYFKCMILPYVNGTSYNIKKGIYQIRVGHTINNDINCRRQLVQFNKYIIKISQVGVWVKLYCTSIKNLIIIPILLKIMNLKLKHLLSMPQQKTVGLIINKFSILKNPMKRTISKVFKTMHTLSFMSWTYMIIPYLQ